jgi:PAT family acetyl-CoA transporter-like MFS transporter 1
VDAFTQATCIPTTDEKFTPGEGFELVKSPFSCAIEADKKRCEGGGGTCHIDRDGYYITNVLCIAIGIVTFVAYIRPIARKLQALPLRAWRLSEADQRR